MKKLALLLCACLCLIIMAATHRKTKMNLKRLTSSSKNQAIVEKSLNGFSKSDATGMVHNAINTIDDYPANTQIWFSRRTVDSVFALLRLDSNSAVKPDGIRIYFSSISPTTINPLHYNNGIVVVSTYNSGTVTENNVNHIIHTDYFDHSQDAGLFSLDSIGGTISHDSDTTNGALLYAICNCDITKPCIATSDHDIKRSIAEKMVQAFYGQPFKAVSEWFDIKMLGYLVDEMKNDSDDGIRIYFARGVASIDNADDVGKARFVVVTTRPSVDPLSNKIIHKDYFDCIHPVLQSAAIHRNEQGVTDNGELCPTNCTGATLR